jgi:hypothetical protein
LVNSETLDRSVARLRRPIAADTLDHRGIIRHDANRAIARLAILRAAAVRSR